MRGYIAELMADILAGTLDPSPVLDTVIPLEEVPAGYAAMDERTRPQGAGADGGGVARRPGRGLPAASGRPGGDLRRPRPLDAGRRQGGDDVVPQAGAVLVAA